MALPTEPVTLSAAEIGELNKQLSEARHDINNSISLIVAAVELIRLKPHMTESMLETIAGQPRKIADRIDKFSAEFETRFGITRRRSPAGAPPAKGTD